ncbi:MAG: histidine kinase, partial [Peptococcaceae bacterium BICA1-8]
MDIRSKNYSHSLITKVIVFIITILCFTGLITVFLDIAAFHQGDFDAAFEKDYYLSQDYMQESSQLAETLTNLIEYKSEENILNGGTITEEEVKKEKDQLFFQFEHDENNYYKYYDPKLSYQENYQKFEEVYTDKIAQIKDILIAEDIKQYNSFLRRLEEYKGVYYYAGDGENVFTNSPNEDKDYFKLYSSYLIFDKLEETVYPKKVRENSHYYWL